MTMAHLMTNGNPCGLKDEHNGHHRSPESVGQMRNYHIGFMRAYRATAKGMVADVQHHANQRGNR